MARRRIAHIALNRRTARRGCLLSRAQWCSLVTCLALLGCQDDTRTTTAVPEAPPEPVAQTPTEPAEDPSPAKAEPEVPIPPAHKASLRHHPAQQAWAMSAGEAPRAMDIARAEAEGYTIIDLSNRWTPYIFWARSSDRDDTRENRYAEVFTALANNERPASQVPAADGGPNFLELFGIPPTPGVIVDEFDAVGATMDGCLEDRDFDASVFEGFDGYIAFDRDQIKKRRSRARWYRDSLRKAMRKARLDPDSPADLEAAATHKKTERVYRKWKRSQQVVDIIANAQVRLDCAGLYDHIDGFKGFRAGEFGWSTHQALAEFQRKHAIFGWGHITQEDIATLKKTPAQATEDRAIRMLTERVISAAGILEDGSAASLSRKFPWTDRNGETHGPENIVAQHVDVAREALGWTDPATTRESLRALGQLRDDGFENLLVAVKLPALPEYYGPDMEFSVVIDRGDVFYDLPYDEEGNPVRQTRRRKPHLTLYVHHEEQKIPLVYWPTTIGSWRSEQHEGQEWLAYKNSDVGRRIWRDIVAAPVWIPPGYTPTRSLVKRAYKDGRWVKEVNYDETGPGFRSAYGLVAAYHIEQVKGRDGDVLRERDHQIRTHGSVDYMSIKSRYSHGCHRLHNGNAVRLFSYLLRRNEFERHGQTELGYARSFEFEEREYTMKLDTRGYRYELREPIPVLVTKGRIRGEAKTPYEGLIPKPGAEPPATDADADAASAPNASVDPNAAPASDTAAPVTSTPQPQG